MRIAEIPMVTVESEIDKLEEQLTYEPTVEGQAAMRAALMVLNWIKFGGAMPHELIGECL